MKEVYSYVIIPQEKRDYMKGINMGDHYNVMSTLTQTSKTARTYLYQMNSYWSML